MADNLTPEHRRKTMSSIRSKGTRIERSLCAMLAGMKLSGWQKNSLTVAGKPDVVFPSEKIALFIDGCFWHGCPNCNVKVPATNTDYWIKKIKRNKLRDIEVAKQLNGEGWIVLRIWEHDMKNRACHAQIRNTIASCIQSRRPT